MTEYAPAKTGEYPSNILQFSKLRVLRKYFKVYKHNSPHLVLKYARIFVLGHYLFLKSHSFPRTTLSVARAHIKTLPEITVLNVLFFSQMPQKLRSITIIAMIFCTLVPFINALPQPPMTEFNNCLIKCRTCLLHCSFQEEVRPDDMPNCLEDLRACQQGCRLNPSTDKPCRQ